MNILAIGAHPDDIQYGCGGTLSKYAKLGHDIHLLVMTKGGVGGKAPVRRQEQMRSAKVLSVKQLFWGGHLEDSQTSLFDEFDEVRVVVLSRP